jgi:hypothetical protein
MHQLTWPKVVHLTRNTFEHEDDCFLFIVFIEL